MRSPLCSCKRTWAHQQNHFFLLVTWLKLICFILCARVHRGNNLYMCIKLWASFFFLLLGPLFHRRIHSHKHEVRTLASCMCISLHTHACVNEYVCNWCHCWHFESRPRDKHISVLLPVESGSIFWACVESFAEKLAHSKPRGRATKVFRKT